MFYVFSFIRCMTPLTMMLMQTTITRSFSFPGSSKPLWRRGWHTSHRMPARRWSAYRQSETGRWVSVKSATEGVEDLGIREEQIHLLPRLYVGDVQPILALKSLDEALMPPQSSPQLPGLQYGSRRSLSPDQARYVSTVLRLFKKRGEALVRIFDGLSGEWLARMSLVDNGVATSSPRRGRAISTGGSTTIVAECLKRLRSQETQGSHSPSCWLCIAVPKKKERVRWILEKATELSVDYIVLLDSDFSEQSRVPLEKMQAYLVEASEQAERLTVPQFVRLGRAPLSVRREEAELVAGYTTLFADFLESAMGQTKLGLFLCRERNAHRSVPVWKALQQHCPHTDAALFIVGPEGGWSPKEHTLMDQVVSNENTEAIACCVSLGPTVLRSETASSAALAAYTAYREFELGNGK